MPTQLENVKSSWGTSDHLSCQIPDTGRLEARQWSAAGNVRALNEPSNPFQEASGSWVLLPAHFALRRGKSQRKYLHARLQLPLCCLWSQGTKKHWALLAPQNRQIRGQLPW